MVDEFWVGFASDSFWIFVAFWGGRAGFAGRLTLEDFSAAKDSYRAKVSVSNSRSIDVGSFGLWVSISIAENL